MLTSLYIFLIGMVCLYYESATPYIDPVWVKHISEKCSVEKVAHCFHHQGVIVMGVMTMPVASYHGILVANRKYGVRQFVNTQAWKILFKIILGLAFGIPVLIGL